MDLKSACSVVCSLVPALCIWDCKVCIVTHLSESVCLLAVTVVDRLCDYVPHTV